MAVTALLVRDFQIHKDICIPIQPGVTSITGATDKGKSALVRALRWVACNQPSGTAHIRHGAKSAQVGLEVDGYRITRLRSSTKNTYHLTHPDGTEYTFAAVKLGVPPDVAAVLQLPEVCFQGQHDGAFWLGDSGMVVAQALNAVVDLGVIDMALGVASSRTYAAKAQMDAAGLALQAAQQRADGLAWVDVADAEWVVLGKAQVAATQARAKAQALAGSIRATTAAQAAYAQAAQAALAARSVHGLGRAAQRARAQATALAGPVQGLQQAAKWQGLPEALELLQVQARGLYANRLARDRLASTVSAVEYQLELGLRAKLEISTLSEELEAKQKEAKVCPTCQRPM